MDELSNMNTIFKELRGINSNVDSFSKTRQFQSSSSNNSMNFVNDKQQRIQKHQAMMKRLNQSKNMMADIIGNNLQEQEVSEKVNQTTTGKQIKSRFVPPKIRYRHLEHLQKDKQKVKEQSMNQTSNSFNSSYKQTRQISTQYQDMSSLANVTQPLNSSKNIDYFEKQWRGKRQTNSNQDILQRYYDICSKKRQSKSRQQESRNKFTRSVIPVEAPERQEKISQAIEILKKR